MRRALYDLQFFYKSRNGRIFIPFSVEIQPSYVNNLKYQHIQSLYAENYKKKQLTSCQQPYSVARVILTASTLSSDHYSKRKIYGNFIQGCTVYMNYADFVYMTLEVLHDTKSPVWLQHFGLNHCRKEELRKCDVIYYQVFEL